MGHRAGDNLRRTSFRNAGRITLWGLLGVGFFAMPMGCLYPDLIFDEPEPSGSSVGGAGGTSSGEGGVGGKTGASSGMTASSSGSVSSGSGGGGEDCLNGSDDDDDGMVDCEDNDCNAGYACVPTEPFGWSGYAALFEGVPGQAPACPSAFPSSTPYVGNHSLLTPPHQCAPCSCGTPTGQTCGLPDKITISNQICGGSGGNTYLFYLTSPANWTGNCVTSSGWPTGNPQCGGVCNRSVTSDPAVPKGGSCAPAGGTLMAGAPQWAILGKACGEASKGGGCGGGQACQPKPQAPFLSGLCVFKSGDNACPMGTFTEKHVFYEGTMDTRSCTTCSCGAPAGGSCSADITVYSTSNCTNPSVTFQTGTCKDLANDPSMISRTATITNPPSGSTCTVTDGGQTMGSLTPSMATTFCCVP